MTCERFFVTEMVAVSRNFWLEAYAMDTNI